MQPGHITTRAHTMEPHTAHTAQHTVLMAPRTMAHTEKVNIRRIASISIIIPSAPERSFQEIIENLRRIRPENIAIQILVVKGTWPPLQRNFAIKKASGEFIFLFDDDVIIPAGTIKKVLKAFNQNSNFDVIGGPNLTPPDNGFLQHCFGYAHASYFTGAGTAARYFPSRRIKRATENHLISCNLAFRAGVLKAHPFDPKIFPNEENDLLLRLQRLGYKLNYDPDFFVYHHRRKNLKSYIKQIFNWGSGRMARTLKKPDNFSPFFFVPLAFLFYLASLPFFHPMWYAVPLFLYLLLDFVFSLAVSFKERCLCFFLVMLALFPLTHIIYALGLIAGTATGFTAYRHLPAEKDLQTIEFNLTDNK